jgi:GtrA-like protein
MRQDAVSGDRGFGESRVFSPLRRVFTNSQRGAVFALADTGPEGAMSASLESLMRQSLAEASHPARFGGIISFLVIGAGAALSFAVISSTAISALPLAPRWIVSAVCYGMFIVPVYLLHRRFSFNSNAPHRRALPRYITAQLASLCLASFFSFVAYGALGLPTFGAALLVIGLTSGVQFVVLRRWAFGVV